MNELPLIRILECHESVAPDTPILRSIPDIWEYYVEYCESHIALLWMGIMLWHRCQIGYYHEFGRQAGGLVR
jgi:hypothetical protein